MEHNGGDEAKKDKNSITRANHKKQRYEKQICKKPERASIYSDEKRRKKGDFSKRKKERREGHMKDA